MKTMKWLVMNGTFAALVYAGFVLGVDGAQNLVKFFIWFILLPLSPFLLTDHAQRLILKEPPRLLLVFLSRAMAWCVLSVLVWSGAWVTGAAYAVTMLFFAFMREAVRKKRAELLVAA
jgi:uncharacterized membrane protein